MFFLVLSCTICILALAPPSSARPPWRRQAQALDVLTETTTDLVSVSLTYTDTVTQVLSAATPSLSTAAATAPAVHLVGDVLDPAALSAQGVLFLPLASPLAADVDASPTLASVSETNTLPQLSVPASASAPNPPVSAVAASASAPVSAAAASLTSLLLGSPASQSSVSASASASSGNTTSPSNSSSGSATIAPAFAPVHTQPAITGPLLSAYYPDWVSDTLSPESIDFTRLDWLDFAFATPGADFNLTWDDPQGSPALLERLVTAAHAKGVKVKLSIGGWDGSKYFSPAVATTASRKTFTANIASVYTQFALDGIDIDWEYPGQQGAGSNKVSPQDSANFLLFLQSLRNALPATARLSAAVQDAPFAGADGNPMKDVSAFAQVLDWVNIMNYDVFGSGTTPGPNAPLANGCGDSSQPQANAAAALAAWTAAKFPAGRLMLGVPFYGYLSASKATTLQHRRRRALRARRQVGNATVAVAESTLGADDDDDDDASTVVLVDTADGSDALKAAAAAASSTSTTTANPQLATLTSSTSSTSSGQIQFASLLTQGALLRARLSPTLNNNTISFVGGAGFARLWDTCSATPFLASAFAGQVVTYDDNVSLGAKAVFAKSKGALGAAVWDISGDTAQWDLLNALRVGLGKPV